MKKPLPKLRTFIVDKHGTKWYKVSDNYGVMAWEAFTNFGSLRFYKDLCYPPTKLTGIWDQ